MRRYGVGAMAVGAIAGVAAFALPHLEPGWHPVAFGLTETPAHMLPADVSPAHPVRVVSTTLDRTGRPIVAARTATDEASAVELVLQGQRAKNAIGVEIDAIMTAAGAPAGNDPSRGDQWHLTRVRAPQAWSKSTGSGVTIAVLDTGVDASHPDLAGQLLPGYDATTRTAADGTDPSGHGTQVAGVIAAVTGNEVGISAMAPNAKILPIRVLAPNGAGYASDMATGVVYAADHGANVVNMSFTTDTRVSAVTNAIAYARSKGVVVVAAGGNGRLRGNPASYPGAEPSVIAVAATDAADQPAAYSTRAGYIDVAAPGNSILSTFPGGRYQAMSGTSAAVPQVSAIAALVKAAKPTLTPDQIETVIEGSATDLGPAGKDPDFGYGLVNAAAAVDAATTTATPSPSSRTTTPPAARAPVKRSTVIKVVSPAKPVVFGTTATVRYTVLAGGKPFARQTAQLGLFPVGSAGYTYTDVATDETGSVEYALPATGRFQIKLVLPATDTSTAATSATSTVGVRSDAVAFSDDTGVLTVDLASPPGLTVQVQRLDTRRLWVNDSTFVVAAGQQTITGRSTGAQYRVVLPSTTSVAGITSNIVAVS